MNRTQVQMVLLADFRELGIEVDFVSFDETLESLEVVVDDTVVEIKTPSTTGS